MDAGRGNTCSPASLQCCRRRGGGLRLFLLLPKPDGRNEWDPRGLRCVRSQIDLVQLYLPGLLLQISDLVCNHCQLVASVGFNKLVSLGRFKKKENQTPYLRCYLDYMCQWHEGWKDTHLLYLSCQSHQIHGVSHSVGLVGADQFQPTGCRVSLNQSDYNTRKVTW